MLLFFLFCFSAFPPSTWFRSRGVKPATAPVSAYVNLLFCHFIKQENRQQSLVVANVTGTEPTWHHVEREEKGETERGRQRDIEKITVACVTVA